jgi:2-polyprenyl-3-methyl-5-hydroxy-6-metoxy-1,4-benzoquinol methylase
MSLSPSQRLRYLAWAGTRALSNPDTGCPGCGSSNTSLVRRKYVVTSLWECRSCGLRFRIPKDDRNSAEKFYQDDYAAGFTTDCPTPEALAALVENSFGGTEKDFKGYISVLNALGLVSGDSILDFGSSWGYGSWQFARAGFRVFSYEVSKPRAAYGKTKLGCNMLESLAELPERVKCLFSAHVIEHLPNPEIMWEAADQVLTDDGLIVCFCPNGDPAREAFMGVRGYDNTWGKVHPLFVTPRFLTSVSARLGWFAKIYSGPYASSTIAAGGLIEGQVTGDELCMVARRAVTRRGL